MAHTHECVGKGEERARESARERDVYRVRARGRESERERDD